MLNNIKSQFFTKKLFTYLGYLNKLKLVKYNKKLQYILELNIDYYKRFSKTYIIFDENDFKKGKEYGYNGRLILIFEGEYLKGKRNGKGKEYNEDGNLIFEGEYLNGIRNGKAKEYYYNGNLKFEGEYLNGKRWNGKYSGNDDIIYELKNGNGFIK